MTADVERRVVEFMERELLGPGTSVGRDDDLLSGEVLDSMGVLRLAAFVGEAFGIDVQPSDFVVENFRTVAVIAGYVARSRERRGGDG
jgi:acyl carrier protein